VSRARSLRRWLPGCACGDAGRLLEPGRCCRRRRLEAPNLRARHGRGPLDSAWRHVWRAAGLRFVLELQDDLRRALPSLRVHEWVRVGAWVGGCGRAGECVGGERACGHACASASARTVHASACTVSGARMCACLCVCARAHVCVVCALPHGCVRVLGCTSTLSCSLSLEDCPVLTLSRSVAEAAEPRGIANFDMRVSNAA
jgi:hypothetical protein